MSNPIKFFIIDQLGMVIGELQEDADGFKLINPLLIQPTQKEGGFALSSNPFFEDSLDINESYVVVKANPKKSILKHYEDFLLKKKTGLVTAQGNLIK